MQGLTAALLFGRLFLSLVLYVAVRWHSSPLRLHLPFPHGISTVEEEDVIPLDKYSVCVHLPCSLLTKLTRGGDTTMHQAFSLIRFSWSRLLYASSLLRHLYPHPPPLIFIPELPETPR